MGSGTCWLGSACVCTPVCTPVCRPVSCKPNAVSLASVVQPQRAPPAPPSPGNLRPNPRVPAPPPVSVLAVSALGQDATAPGHCLSVPTFATSLGSPG